MGALTYIALLIIDGDEAYAGIIGDVLCRPRDINLRASFIKKAQSVARGIAHGFQLLPLTFVNYCGKKGGIRQLLLSQSIKPANNTTTKLLNLFLKQHSCALKNTMHHFIIKILKHISSLEGFSIVMQAFIRDF